MASEDCQRQQMDRSDLRFSRPFLYDLDAERGTLMIRQGKDKKDRMVPIGDRAAAWTTKYLNEVRPRFVVEPDDGALFLTNVSSRRCSAMSS